MKIILQINGGLGKSIAATAVCKAIKTQYPDSKLIVFTGYPEVFAGNKYVNERRSMNEVSYFYQQHVKGQPENLFFFHDPYHDTEFIQCRGHLIEVWCKMFGIRYNGEQPELFISHKEVAEAGKVFASPKPIFAIQTNGGISKSPDKYSWARDMPLGMAQQIVDHFAKEYNVVHIRRQDQAPLQNAYPVTADFRTLAVLLMMSKKRLFIDSFAQHAAAALGLPSVVVWIANAPSQFGYAIHHNIIANEPTLEPDLKNSYLSKFNIVGPPSDFPYENEDQIFNVDEIIAAVTANEMVNS